MSHVPASSVRQNKANFRRDANPEIGVPGTVRAKQSQKAVAGSRWSVVGWKSDVQTKPVLAGDRGSGIRGQRPDTGHPTPERSGETKPNSGGRYTPPFHYYSIIPIFQARACHAKQDAHDKSPRIGHRPAFLSECQGSIRLIPTFVGRVKQSQFARPALPPGRSLPFISERQKHGSFKERTRQ